MTEEEERGREESGDSGEGGSEDGRITITVGEVGEGERREDNEEEGEVESDGCGGGCERVMFFSVGEVRRRLSHHVMAPRKTFKRDPDDPSGDPSGVCMLLYRDVHVYNYHSMKCS